MAAAQKIFEEICAELERFKAFYATVDLQTKGGKR
jgi:hypothetical protein